jgi:hypothetical protein
MKMELQIWNYACVIVAIYAPTDDSKANPKNEFQSELTLLTNISRRKEVTIIGDLNARIGRKGNDPVVGNFGRNVLRDNGERLIEICQTHSIKILNGYFQHRDIHKYTWLQPTRNLNSVID